MVGSSVTTTSGRVALRRPKKTLLALALQELRPAAHYVTQSLLGLVAQVVYGSFAAVHPLCDGCDRMPLEIDELHGLAVVLGQFDKCKLDGADVITRCT